MYKLNNRYLFLVVAVVLTSITIFYFNSKNTIDDDQVLGVDTNVFSKQENTSSLTLARLKIPKINIDATIEQVGLAPDGSVDVPKGPLEVAWFNLGPRPGELGSSVIDGHSGWKNDTQAAFDNLYKLQKGDKVYVEDSKGIVTTFVVRETRKYNPKSNPLEVFNSNDQKAHLNLITCSGAWNEFQKTHSERLVVFTDKE